jgi:hypothetical protein
VATRFQRTLIESGNDCRWSNADYELRDGNVVPLFDPWAPAQKTEPEVLEPEAPPEPPAEPNQDFWFSVGLRGEVQEPIQTDFDCPKLPHFNPHLSRKNDFVVEFDEPLLRGARFKAKIVAMQSAIATPWERARLSNTLEDLFDEYPSSGTYRRWLEVASEIEDAEIVELAVELKRTWDQTPEYWYFRTGPNSAPQFHEKAQAQLGWGTALRIAASNSAEIVDHLMNTEMLDDWRDLPGPCPGFWSFGSYVELMAVGDEFETSTVAALTQIGQTKLRSTFMFETAAPKVARIHSGVVFGEAARVLEDAYQAWVAKHETETGQGCTPAVVKKGFKRKKRGH